VSCLEKTALIHGYLDGELDLVNSLQVEDHLRECAMCGLIYRIVKSCSQPFEAETFTFSLPKVLLRASIRLCRIQREPDALH